MVCPVLAPTSPVIRSERPAVNAVMSGALIDQGADGAAAVIWGSITRRVDCARVAMRINIKTWTLNPSSTRMAKPSLGPCTKFATTPLAISTARP